MMKGFFSLILAFIVSVTTFPFSFLPFRGGPNKKKFKSSENRAAFTGEFEDSFGIGLYTAERNVFVPGVFERGNTVEKDPSVGNPTSYFAVMESRLLKAASLLNTAIISLRAM